MTPAPGKGEESLMDAKTRTLIQDDEVSLKEVVHLLQRRKWRVGLVVLAFGDRKSVV